MEKITFTLPRMVSLAEAAEQTGLTYHCLRDWCLSGKIPYLRAGGSRGKILVNADRLAEFLYGEVAANE